MDSNQILNPKFCNLGKVINLNNKDLIAKDLYVPKFQRYYSWEDKEVTQLLNDILDSFENKEDYYFLGTIQLTDFKGDDKYAIIDGQQRLTTLLLITKCLMNRIKDKSFNVIDISITNDEVWQKYYDEIIKSNKINCHSSEENLYYKNYKIIETFLNEKDDNKNNDDFEKELLNYIFDNLYVIIISSKQQPLSKIIKIFDTLNTTGMDLNSGDLFKIKFSEYLINGDNSKYEETIEKISKQYERITDLNEKWKDERWTMDEVLLSLQHIIIAHNNLNLEDLKKGREKFFEDYFTNNADRYLTFDHFKTLIDVILRVIEMRNNNSLEFKYRYAQDILFWTRYWRCWSFPYVSLFFKANAVNGIENVDDEWIKMVFKNEYYLAQFLTVYSVLYDRYIDDVYRYYIKVLVETNCEISNNNYFNEFLSKKLASVVDKWKPTGTNDSYNTGAVNDFKMKMKKNLHNKFVICKWVALFEELCYSKKNDKEMKDLLFNFNDENEYRSDIEHIFPRNKFDEREEYVEDFEGIGNLTLLEQSINRNVKDYMDKKYNEYRKSKYWFPSEIVKSDIKPEEFDWTIDNINERINRIEKLFSDEFIVINKITANLK